MAGFVSVQRDLRALFYLVIFDSTERAIFFPPHLSSDPNCMKTPGGLTPGSGGFHQANNPC